MEFQPKDWCPDPVQWKAIQEKLNNLKEEVVMSYQQSHVPSVNSSNHMPSNIPTVHAPKPSFSAGNGGVRQMQMLPEEDGVSPPDVIVIPDEIPQTASGMTMRPSMETISSKVLATGGKKFRTPTDLSGKPYTSGFK